MLDAFSGHPKRLVIKGSAPGRRVPPRERERAPVLPAKGYVA